LKIYGRMYPLMARIEKLNGFSAHADAVDFETLFAPIAPKLRAAFVVHGEDKQPIAMKKMLNRLGCKTVYTPKSGDIIPLR
jgi:metallo-beta-lactamase family protein